MKYDNRARTRQSFTLTGREHRGAPAGNERLVWYVEGESGLLAVYRDDECYRGDQRGEKDPETRETLPRHPPCCQQ